MHVLFTDHRFPDIELERSLLAAAGIGLKVAQCASVEEVIEASAGCQALLITYAPADARVFAARPEIGICSRIGAGYDTINVADAERHGVWVANSPDYGSSEVALHALSMALALARHLPRYDAAIRAGAWDAHGTGATRRLADLTVGVLGYGRIGSRFAYFAHTMFGRVIAHDPFRIDGDFAPYVEPVGLEHLFRDADLVSIHVPLNDQTRGLVGARLLDLMKPGSYLVNTARGAIVDVDALVARLGRFDGVGLDVLPVEPVPRDSPLLQAGNVLLSPHAAYYTTAAERELRRKAVQNIVSWFQRGRPDYPVVVGTRQPPAR
ncbi:MAG: C-terminal binding protein [Burkholderiales bacterium]|nr:C-terminal binding protein [Burkholderiales bacterium]